MPRRAFHLPASLLALTLTLVACGPEALDAEEEEPLFFRSDEVVRWTPSFKDNFGTRNTSDWIASDSWSNGGFFDVGWRADNVWFGSGQMVLALNNMACPMACSNEPYASGEYVTREFFSYGLFEVRMKAARGSGVVSSFFVTSKEPRDEIDIEILGRDPTKMQTNYWRDGVGGNETFIPLGFDASAAFHTYGIRWSSHSIQWYVDGVKVHEENGNRGPLPERRGRMAMNLWVSDSLQPWLGPFTYTGLVTASYDWARWARH